MIVGSDDAQIMFYRITLIILPFAYLLCKFLTSGRFGDALIGIRDDEARLRFSGFNPVLFKVIVFLIAGGLAGISGAHTVNLESFHRNIWQSRCRLRW